jgi:hypothetical protein
MKPNEITRRPYRLNAPYIARIQAAQNQTQPVIDASTKGSR